MTYSKSARHIAKTLFGDEHRRRLTRPESRLAVRGGCGPTLYPFLVRNSGITGIQTHRENIERGTELLLCFFPLCIATMVPYVLLLSNIN